MQNGFPNASSPASPGRSPEFLFANWREMLNQLKLTRDVRHTYAQAIELPELLRGQRAERRG